MSRSQAIPDGYPPSRRNHGASKVKLGDKIRYLREVEGSLRGMNRAMSQLEVARAIEAETGSKLSQSYLSQIESGARPHMTNTTRQTLSAFFKVHPGYLVDDPEGYSPELQSDLRKLEDRLDMWLIRGRGALPARSGAQAGSAHAGAPRALARMPAAAGVHSRDSGTGPAAELRC